MHHTTHYQKPEQERFESLNRLSLETSPPELRQLLTYVLHLRSYWKPEGHAKLVVPTSWMGLLNKCEVDCAVDRCCPFRNVRFASDAETRLVAPGGELPRDIALRLLTKLRMVDLATLVPRAFEDIPRTRLKQYSQAHWQFLRRSQDRQASDMPTTTRTPGRIDFALVPGHGSNDTENLFPESDTNTETRYLLLGTKESTQMQHGRPASFDSRSGPRTISKELSSHGQLHLKRLASLTKREVVGTTTEPFPEWLVLFGIMYDAHHVRVVAYVPRRRQLDVIECAAYVVDELSIRVAAGAPTCELAHERLRLLLALTTLRRHVHHLSRSLFATVVLAKRIDERPSLANRPAQARDDSDELRLDRCASLGSSECSSSEYSTCPSSACELDDVPIVGYRNALSSESCKSFTSSSCSSCLTLFESALCSEDSGYTSSDDMEPIAISKRDGSGARFTQSRRLEIIAWARKVVPTEHPVRDTYRMIICGDHSRG